MTPVPAENFMNVDRSLLEQVPAYESTIAQSFSLSVLVPVYNECHHVEASLRRVLALRHELIRELEIIVVDDCSRDGSWEIVQRLAAQDSRLKVFRHEKNQGKGAAVRTAIAHASCDISVVHDADLEYNPADIPALLVPFAKEGADAVFGSRYLSAPYRRALMYRHTMINRLLTLASNIFTDLHLTDMETCYKAITTKLLKSIPIRSHDFRFEVEIVFKLAKRRARIFEVPIRYLPRTQEEGKKIKPKDGLLAFAAMARYWLIDDLYHQDQYGSHMLASLERARKFNLWMGQTLRPFIGDRVLEIGAGIGNLTAQFIPRELYVASDINPTYLNYLQSYSFGKPYLRVMKVDAGISDDYRGLENQFDTVVMLNVLEHLPDQHSALRSLYEVLQPGGRAIILVPQHQWLYGTLDESLEHRERYSAEKLRGEMKAAGFEIETMFDFNRFSVPGWWWNGKIFRRRTFSRIQLKIVDTLVPILRRIDRLWPWSGLSVIGIGLKK
jgi:glycosyltransferase involved in cell wall biosynthesis